MHGLQIKTKTGKKYEQEQLPFVTFLLPEAGVLGFLLYLRAMNGIEYRSGLVLPAAIASGWLVWYCYTRRRPWFWCLLSAVTAGCILVCRLQGDVLWSQFFYIIEGLADRHTSAVMPITEMALLLAVVLPFLLFVLECLIKRYNALSAIAGVLLPYALFWGIHIHVETVFLLFLFQFAFWTMSNVTTRRQRKKQLFNPGRAMLAFQSGAAISLMVAAAFFAALIFVAFASRGIYDMVSAADGYVRRSMSNASDSAAVPVSGGRISLVNNYPTGTPHLKVLAFGQPTENLYLRGFCGGTYVGGNWTRSNDKALLEEITGELSWRPDSVKYLYEDMYYIMNAHTLTGENPEPITLMIQHENSDYTNTYAPYYNENRDVWGDVGYAYQYYEEKDMHIDWEDVEPGYEELMDMCRELQEVYMEHAITAYTQVPTESLPRLTALVEQNPLTDPDEITAFILYTLHSNATYTLTPGWTPFNDDVVEYFLFERKAGFCEHFAAAATLMYRLYGIPARYAAGYMISPSDFEMQESGSYLAIATDESAHAWVEIFLEDYGWTPVEVTPASGGSRGVSYAGIDDAELDGIWKEQGWDVEEPDLTPDSDAAESMAGMPEETEFLLNEMADGKILIFCIVCSVLLPPLLLYYRRQQLVRNADAAGCRAVFYRFMELVHFGGFMMGYDGSEEDFASQLAGADTGITKEEASRLVRVINQAAYGPSCPDEADEAFVRRLYRRTAARIYQKLSWGKKLVYKYVKVF